jgi:hypothetical protein
MLHNYQKQAVAFLLERITEGRGAGLLLDPGPGKTLGSLECGGRHTTGENSRWISQRGLLRK